MRYSTSLRHLEQSYVHGMMELKAGESIEFRIKFDVNERKTVVNRPYAGRLQLVWSQNSVCALRSTRLQNHIPLGLGLCEVEVYQCPFSLASDVVAGTRRVPPSEPGPSFSQTRGGTRFWGAPLRRIGWSGSETPLRDIWRPWRLGRCSIDGQADDSPRCLDQDAARMEVNETWPMSYFEIANTTENSGELMGDEHRQPSTKYLSERFGEGQWATPIPRNPAPGTPYKRWEVTWRLRGVSACGDSSIWRFRDGAATQTIFMPRSFLKHSSSTLVILLRSATSSVSSSFHF